MRAVFLPILLAGCALTSGDPTPNEYYEIDSFSDPIVLSVVERMKGRQVLFVFDIDNTLLKFPHHQFVGSDQWYQWQNELPNESPRKVHCVFEMQAIGYRLQNLIETEHGISSAFVESLQRSGRDVIALTARGYDVRAATEKELLRNGFDFSQSLPGGNLGIIGTYLPQANSFLPNPRKVSYLNGVAMVAGQNKGYMIRDLISRLKMEDIYDVVVFFDDNPKNTTAVREWFSTDPLSSVVFLYQGVNVDLDQYDLDVADAEKDVLLQAFGVFDRRQECEYKR